MLVVLTICQIIILYVLIFTENWNYFVLDYWRVWRTVETIMFDLLCMFVKN
jgi:hypothetical protein